MESWFGLSLFLLSRCTQLAVNHYLQLYQISSGLYLLESMGLLMAQDVQGMSSSLCDFRVLPGAPAGGCCALWSAPMVQKQGMSPQRPNLKRLKTQERLHDQFIIEGCMPLKTEKRLHNQFIIETLLYQILTEETFNFHCTLHSLHLKKALID